MVWGVVEPNGFGDFFLYGDYAGWEEAIKRYFDEEMSAEQRASFDDWDVAYRGDVASLPKKAGGCLSRTNDHWNTE
jgi:hypothetical protein